MKKGAIIFLLIIFAIVTGIFIFFETPTVKTVGKINPDEVTVISIRRLPPDVKKVVDRKEDIVAVTEYLNSLRFWKMINGGQSNGVGYEIVISGSKEYEIVLFGSSEIFFDGVWYELDYRSGSKFDALYAKLDYPEEKAEKIRNGS